MTEQERDQLAINTIRTLSIDAVQQAVERVPTAQLVSGIDEALSGKAIRGDRQRVRQRRTGDEGGHGSAELQRQRDDF